MCKKKVSYFLPYDTEMYDTSYCIAKCVRKDCARQKVEKGIHTVSDFTNTCRDFEKEGVEKEKRIKKFVKMMKEALKKGDKDDS